MLELLKALADPCRLRLVAVLLRGEFTVQELTRILDMGQSRISRHLKILTEAGALSVKRQGTWSYYRAAGRGSACFALLRPALEQGIEDLPERNQDLAAVALVLEARRRRSQEFFDQHARQWDDLARTLLPVPDYQEQLLAMVPQGKKVVEIGLGTGGLLPGLAAKSASVIGVDHSPAMLAEARRRLDSSALGDIELRLGEMTHLPLSDNCADCAVLNMVLHHAADPPAVLSEIRRILVSGGLLVLADLVRHEREWVREQLADQWLGFEEDEVKGWLKSAGFEAIKVERIAGAAGQEAVLVVRAGRMLLPPPSPLLNEEGERFAASLDNNVPPFAPLPDKESPLVSLIDKEPAFVPLIDKEPPFVHLVDKEPPFVHLIDKEPPFVPLIDREPPFVHLIDKEPTFVPLIDKEPPLVPLLDKEPPLVPLLDKEGLGVVNSAPAKSDAPLKPTVQIHNKPNLKPFRKSLRNESTPAERELWNVLRQGTLGGYKFRRQHSVGRFILDFYCSSKRLAIELDGDSHFTDEAMEYDQERTAFLNGLNIRVLRFLNSDVHENLDAVCERILEELTTPSPLGPSELGAKLTTPSPS